MRCFSRSGRRVHLSHCQSFECLRLLSFHMNPEDLQKLATLAMPFGKHKGVLLADLPGNYLGWFAREGFPKGEMGRLLALMYELDHNGLRELLTPLRQGRP